MKAAIVLVSVLVSFSAASQEPTGKQTEPCVEILGVEVFRGMPESEVRAAFPRVSCAGEKPVNPVMDYCAVSDGVSPDADGEVTFENGLVRSATRYWHIPDDADPLEALMMLNDILMRLTGEDEAACAEIETYSDEEPAYTIITLANKVVTVQMHNMPGRSGAYFKESLRVNPVPDTYTTRAKKMQGAERCAYVK
jgi:hypothetical protein